CLKTIRTGRSRNAALLEELSGIAQSFSVRGRQFQISITLASVIIEYSITASLAATSILPQPTLSWKNFRFELRCSMQCTIQVHQREAPWGTKLSTCGGGDTPAQIL